MRSNDCVWLFFVSIYHLAKDWQTLIAALIALGAAWWAGKIAAGQLAAARDQIHVARDQIAANQAQVDRERIARLRAARASLPVALSAICDYAQAVGEALYSVWPNPAKLHPDPLRWDKPYRMQVQIPPFPPEVLAAFEKVVEHTDVEPVAERIESMLREAQILSARTRSLAQGTDLTNIELAKLIIQSASIYGRADTLFTYARRKTDGVNSADLWERVDAALRVMKISENLIAKIIREEQAAGRPPGEADSEEPS